MVEQHGTALPPDRGADLFRIQVVALELRRLLGSLEQWVLVCQGDDSAAVGVMQLEHIAVAQHVGLRPQWLALDGQVVGGAKFYHAVPEARRLDARLDRKS